MKTSDWNMTYQEAERNTEQHRELIQKYIREWSKRKSTKRRSGDQIPLADMQAYIDEANKYFTLQDKMNATTDISERNILSYKIRAIESKFDNLMTYTREKLLKQ